MNKIVNTDFKFNEPTRSDFETYQSSGYIINDSSFFFAISKNEQVEFVQGNLSKTTETLFLLLKDNNEKEKFYVTAIKNLLKQKKYLNLIYELTNNIIDQEEFNKELSEKESHYLIKANEQLDSLDKIKNLNNVLNKINENFNEEDLIEIFSISDSFIFKNIALPNISNQIDDEVGI